MANANNLSGVTSDPGNIVSPNTLGRATDFVVGRYDEYGGKKGNGEIVGGKNEATRLKRLLLNSMSNRGGALLPGFVMTENGPMKASQLPPPPVQVSVPVKGKKGKKGQVQVQAPTYIAAPIYEPPPKPPTFLVEFNIESGTIKSNADAILENKSALVLVYEGPDAVSYTPKRGAIVSLTYHKRTVDAMYLGVQLPWYNTNQQLLLFMKVEE